jgi:hypothetical protein
VKHLRPFIPAWLDELELTPFEYRVLSHLWRRANRQNVCWPSVQTIADGCRLHRDTVEKALRGLTTWKLIGKYKRHRNSNGYRMLFPLGDTRSNQVSDSRQIPEETGQQIPGQTGTDTRSNRHEIPGQTGYQGISGKDLQRKITIDGGEKKSGFVELVWKEGGWNEILEEYPELEDDEDGVQVGRWLRDLNANERKYYTDRRGSPTWDHFMAYIGEQLKAMKRGLAVTNGRAGFSDAPKLRFPKANCTPHGNLVMNATTGDYTDERGRVFHKTADGKIVAGSHPMQLDVEKMNRTRR